MVYGCCSSESGQSLVVEVVVEGWLNGGDGRMVFRPKTPSKRVTHEVGSVCEDV